jgi:hypothetical protein
MQMIDNPLDITFGAKMNLKKDETQ